MSEWISVKERFPKTRGDYLAVWRSGNERVPLHGEPVVSILYFKGKQWSVEQAAHRRVTHWMPLPEPPKENADE